MRILWKVLIIIIIVAGVDADCSQAERCPCLESSDTLLCTSTSCKSLFTPSGSLSYNHLVFTSDQGCKPCSYSCRICLSETLCAYCENEYHLVNGTCRSCDIINCLVCNNESCLACLEGYFLDQKTGLCQSCPIVGTKECPSSSTISSCQPSYFLTNDGARCIECDPNCTLCVSQDMCSTCRLGFYVSNWKCYACSAECLGCQSQRVCSSCRPGSYLTITGSCLTCNNKYSGCSQCNNISCTVCQKGYYLVDFGCQALPTSKIIDNCTAQNSTMGCDSCQQGYFLSRQGKCLPYCSNLCLNCSGPHFGLCSSCSNTSFLFNMNCIPLYSIKGGLAYQMLLTPRNNPTIWTLNSQILPQSYCLETVAGNTNSIEYVLQKVGGYSVKLQWKIYILNIAYNNVTFGYSVTFNDNSATKFNNLTSPLELCRDTSSLEYVEKNSITFDKIDATNVVVWKSQVAAHNIGISELILTVSRCGGLYGTNCLVCSSLSQCTVCRNGSYLINGADCVAQCPANTYTYVEMKKCYETCPIGSYNVNSNLKCLTCNKTCKSCSSLTVCLMCNPGFYLDGRLKTCVETCPDRYYANSQTATCDACVYPCLTCYSVIQCKQCYFGFLDTKTLGCSSQCPDGTYGNLEIGNCTNCTDGGYHCRSCLNSPDKCLSCDALQPYLLNYKCYAACPDGYSGQDGQCTPCSPECRTCAAQKCTSCNFGYLLNSTCGSCPPGYFSNAFTLQCELCAVGCKSCTQSADFCQQCSDGYVLFSASSKCLISCPETYYKQQKLCILCRLPCRTCVSESQCLTCWNLFMFNGSCIEAEKCPNGTYPSYTTLSCQSCVGCLTCRTANICLTCPPTNYLYAAKCVSTCPDGTYVVNSTCQQCQIPCLNCNGSSCLSCREGYYQLDVMCLTSCPDGYYVNLTKCQSCPSSCKRCLNTTFCQQCRYPYNLSPISNLCVEQCDNGTYSQSLVCLYCQPPCLACLNLQTCLTCIDGLQHQGRCIDSCPTGTYQLNKVCQKCHEPCLTCLSEVDCSSCVSGLLLKDRRCVESCGVGYFQNLLFATCTKCIDSCITCQFSQFNCTSCRVGFLFRGDCISICPFGMYAEQGNCINCDVSCVSCLNKTYCQSCANGFYLLPDVMTCSKECRRTEYAQEALQMCLACVYPCRRCKDKLNCLSCLSGAYYQDQCLQTCPVGTYRTLNLTEMNLAVCLNCTSQCQLCKNSTYCLSCADRSLFLSEGKCLKHCPDGQYGQSQACLPCMKVCRTCTDSISCTACRQGILHKGQCLYSCPEGYVKEGDSCKECGSGCLTCITTTDTCLSCTTGLYLISRQCLLACPIGYFPYPINQTCLPCQPPCERCRDAYTCQSCQYGFILYRAVSASQCIAGPYCPNSYYLNIDLKQCVLQHNCPSNFLKQPTKKTCSSQCPQNFVQYQLQCLFECPSGFWTDENLICRPASEESPTPLPYLSCRQHTIRNILTIFCELNTPSYNLPSITVSNISLTIDATISIIYKSRSQLTLLVFPTEKKVYDRLVKMTLLNRYSLRSNSRIPIQVNPINIVVSRFDSYSADSRQVGLYMYQVAASLSEAAIILWIVGIIRNRAVESVALLDMLQSFHVLRFLDVRLPPNLNQFLEGFQYAFMMFLPSGFEKKLTKLQNFYVVNGGVSFFSNFMPMIIVMLIFGLAYVLLLALKNIVGNLAVRQESHQKLLKKVELLQKRFHLDHINDCCYVISLPLFLFGTAQLTELNTKSDYFGAGLAFILSITIIGCICYLTTQYRRREPTYLKMLAFFVRGINEECSFGVYHIPIRYCQKLLFGLLIVLGGGSFTLACLFVMSCCRLAMDVRLPFSISLVNYYHMVIEVLWLGLFLTLGVGILYQDEWSPEIMAILGGGACLIIILMSLLAIVYASAQLLMMEWFQEHQVKQIQKQKQLYEDSKEPPAAQLGAVADRLIVLPSRRIFSPVQSFFSKSAMGPIDPSEDSRDMNLIRKNYLFQESNEGQDDRHTGHILIKCVKKLGQDDISQK